MRSGTASLEYGRWLIAIGGALLAALATWYEWFTPLDRLSYDLVNELSPLERADDIVIVAIDEDSLRDLGRWPWPREYHVQLLRRLQTYNVKALAIDVVFSEPELEYPEVDTLFAEALGQYPIAVLPVFVGQLDRAGGGLVEVLPFPALYDAASALGHVHIEVDSDGVARSVFLEEGLGDKRWPHFSLSLARQLGEAPVELPGNTVRHSTSDAQGYITRNYEGLIPFMGPAGTIARVSYSDVLNGTAPAPALADKVVFIGATAAGHVDNITTSLGQIPGVELNANIFQALRSGGIAQTLSLSIATPLAALLSGLFILVLTRLEPRAMITMVGVSILILSISAYVNFMQGYWWSPLPVIFALLLAYLVWNWLRLDAALRAVRRQIKTLRDESRRVVKDTPLPRLRRTLEFLQSVDILERWQLTELSAGQSTRFHDTWRHAGGFTERIVELNPGTVKLDLFWRDETQRLSDDQLDLLFSTRSGRGNLHRNLTNVDLELLERAYREAKHSRALTKASLDYLFSAVVLADISGSILIHNQRARQILDIPAEGGNVLTALSRLRLVDAPPISQLLAKLLTDGKEFTHEATSEQSGNYLCRARVITVDRPLLLIAINDVTELKRSERRRAEALDFLSHDLRAPLTSVLALIDGAREQELRPENAALLSEIEQYVRRNLSYAENYIHLSRLQQGELPRQDDCDAQSLVDNAAAQLYHVAAKRGITLNMAYGDETLWVRCNRVMVERVLLNLMDNAIKFSPDDAEVCVAVTGTEQQVRFAIEDRGPGVSSGDVSRLMEAFAQGDSRLGGVGLGLRFVGVAAEALDATIDVQNRPGGGSCFTFTMHRMSEFDTV